MIAYFRYYPHHYAPYMSDLKDFCHLQLTYDRAEPFLPFEQLLAVLPPASKDHLPEAYWVRFVCPPPPSRRRPEALCFEVVCMSVRQYTLDVVNMI